MGVGSQTVRNEGVKKDHLAEFLSRDHDVINTAINSSGISVSIRSTASFLKVCISCLNVCRHWQISVKDTVSLSLLWLLLIHKLHQLLVSQTVRCQLKLNSKQSILGVEVFGCNCTLKYCMAGQLIVEMISLLNLIAKILTICVYTQQMLVFLSAVLYHFSKVSVL